MTKKEKEIADDLDSKLSFDPHELTEIVTILFTPYENTFNKGEKSCLSCGCYQTMQKPAAL